jgi:hypothetical protein
MSTAPSLPLLSSQAVNGLRGFLSFSDHNKSIADLAVETVQRYFSADARIKTFHSYGRVAFEIYFHSRGMRDEMLAAHRYIRVDDAHELSFAPLLKTSSYTLLKDNRHKYEALIHGRRAEHMSLASVYKVVERIVGAGNIHDLTRFHPKTDIIHIVFNSPDVAREAFYKYVTMNQMRMPIVPIPENDASRRPEESSSASTVHPSVGGGGAVRRNTTTPAPITTPTTSELDFAMKKLVKEFVVDGVQLDPKKLDANKGMYTYFTTRGRLYMAVEDQLHELAEKTSNAEFKENLRSLYFKGHEAFFCAAPAYYAGQQHESSRQQQLDHVRTMSQLVCETMKELTPLMETYLRIVESGPDSDSP